MKQFVNFVIEIACLLVFVSVFFSLFRGAEVHGSSMYPFLKDGDFFIVFKTNNIDYGDIISVDSSELHKIICKRVIGLEGDKIELKNGVLYRNDEFVEESYVQNKNDSDNMSVVVGVNEVFVMGDNRPVSLDSRQIGCLGVDDIVGKLFVKSPVGVKGLHVLWFISIVVLLLSNIRGWCCGFRKFFSFIRGKGNK